MEGVAFLIRVYDTDEALVSGVFDAGTGLALNALGLRELFDAPGSFVFNSDEVRYGRGSDYSARYCLRDQGA